MCVCVFGCVGVLLPVGYVIILVRFLSACPDMIAVGMWNV